MIVVLGAGGFIGTYLVRHLVDNGHEVLACDVSDLAHAFYGTQGVAYEHVDITNESDLSKLPERVDAVVNLACVQPANTSERAYDPGSYLRVNTLGTANVLK